MSSESALIEVQIEDGKYPPGYGSGGYPFRPIRRSAQSIFGELAPKSVAHDRPCEVKNLSYGGALLRSKSEFDVGERFQLVARTPDKVLINIDAKVQWIQRDTFGFDLGVRFSTSIDFAKLERDVREQVFRQTSKADLDGLFRALPADYAMLSSELMHHLAALSIKAAALEPAGTMTDASTRNMNARRLLNECGPAFRTIWYRCNDVVRTVPRDSPEFAAIKWHTENVLRPHFMNAPVFERSWTKPLGYPGDYRIMLYAYESGEPVGAPTLVDDVLHLYFAHTFGECVRGRMTLTIDAIRRCMERTPTSADNPFKMMNLGCGAAIELPQLFDEKVIQGKHAQVALIDQDSDALTYAVQNSILPIARHKGRVAIQPFHTTFKELMKPGDLADHLGEQDVIYSLGLIDYFTTRRANGMAREYWKRLKPGDLPGAEITLEMEASGQMWVMTARKPI